MNEHLTKQIYIFLLLLFELDGRWRCSAVMWCVCVRVRVRADECSRGGKKKKKREKENFGRNGGRRNDSERTASTNG